MKKRIFSLLLALLIILGSMPLTLLSAAAESAAPASTPDYTKPLVMIVPSKRHFGRDTEPAAPDASGYACFEIIAVPLEGKNHLEEDITVNYYTEDKSAIAAAGDYEAKSGTVVLTKDKNYVEIAVKTYKADYAINLHVDGGNKNYNYISRSFLFKIEIVSGNARVDDRDEVECALLAEHTLEAYKYPNTTVLAPYTSHGNYNLVNVLVTEPCDGGEFVYKKIPVSFPASWAADYADTDIDAKLYMALRDAHIEEHWDNETDHIRASIGDVVVELSGEFHDNEEFGWGAGILYAVYGEKGKDNKYKDYWDENFISTRIPTFSNKVIEFYSSNSSYDKIYIENAIKDKYIIRRKWESYGEPNVTAQDPNEFYVGLRDSALSWNELQIRLESFGGYDRKLSGGTVTFRLEDITAPQIEKNSEGNYVVYHNLDTAVKGDTLRLAIRFNEPVQVQGKNNPYFLGRINGDQYRDAYGIRFDYVGGSGTDTLYFEAEYTGDMNITSITNISFKYADSIKDFAGTANSFVVPSDFGIYGLNLDMRKPIISVSKGDSQSLSYEKSRKITVNVSQISDTAELYYAWVAPGEIESGKTPEFVNNLTLEGTPDQDYVTREIVYDGDGEKYLYLKVVSRYGQEQTLVRVMENTGAFTQKDYLGPYKFDNTPPAFENAPNIVSVDNQVVYECEIFKPKDSGSGFSNDNAFIEMYYVGADGENHLISDKTLTPKSFKDANSVKMQLSASDVGVGKNERRAVTIFFTLTDNIGNTATDVARQTVIFDTHEYIDIESVVVPDDFSGKTEILDEGFTFVYSGDISEKINGKYYAFEFKVKGEYLNGDTKILITRNGSEPVNVHDVKVYRENGNQVALENVDEIPDGEVVTVKIDFNQDFSEGYYDIQIQCYENSTESPDRVSKNYRLYVGTGKGKLDEQVQNGTVLINKIYQLPSPSYFYYMDSSDNSRTVKRELYNNTMLSASFSSIDKARQYVLFNEYRDLYAVTLTAELAQALNYGTSNAQKASDKEPVAVEGQVWIRYKSSTWSVEAPYDGTKWVYYYYGIKDTLDVSMFSDDLKNALNAVTNSIVARGKEVSLPELSAYNGQDITSFVQKLGPPTLAPEQVHSKDEFWSDEECSSKFLGDVKYNGDTAIYSSEIVLDGIQYILMGNVGIPFDSRIQILVTLDDGTTAWKDLEFSKGQRFSDVLKDPEAPEKSIKCRIRELGSGGVSEFNVYIDNTAPTLQITWKDDEGSTKKPSLNKNSEKDFRSSSFKIIRIVDGEYDKYSYVALYKAKNFELQGVYRSTDFNKSPITVPDGDYYMVVSDRSGNSYVITLRINSTPLNCEIVESENVKIKFNCNRQVSEIQEFYVKRDGVLVSGAYAPTLEFTTSGMYEFYVRDIYGNVYNPTLHEFVRIYPTVEWKYRNEAGFYVAPDKNNKTKQFSLDPVADGIYTISTSVSIKFKLSGDYGYTFVGIVPEYDENIRDNTVTIKTIQPFQLKIYYKKHPEVYTVYNCVVDTVAPVIEASFQTDTPVPDELEELRKAVNDGTVVKNGDKLIPSKISYSSTMTLTKYIANNDFVLSDLIKVNVHDDGGISYINIYHNGILIETLSGEGYTSDIALSKSGKYQIVAEDILGNKSEFNFTNASPENVRYVLDGLPIEMGLHDFENFDENGNYTDISYGNESATLLIAEKVNVFYMITDSKGAKHFVAFDVNGKEIREAYYCLNSDGKVVFDTSEALLFNGNDSKITQNKDYVIYEIGKTGIKINAMVNSNGDIALTVFAAEESPITVETRVNTEDREFYYAKIELSNTAPNLIIRTDGNLEIFPTDDIQLFPLNCPFTIAEYRFVNDKINTVEVYYSKTNDFDNYGYLLKDEIYESGKKYDKEGFYFIRLVNEYKNESCFIVHISYKFTVTSYSEFADGEKAHFSAEYTAPIYSNKKVVFEVYSNGASINVKKDGADYQPAISNENGVTYVILSEDGNYTVSFTDAHKNNIVRSATINSQKSAFNENLLTGYNENALKKDEGYTNQKLSVNKDVLEEEGICYLEIQYGDTVKILLDSISEDTVALNEESLVNCIGSLGDGVYTVTTRNRYGTVYTKVIHYRSTPTLILERVTRTSLDPEIYDINKALSVGFWSNSELIFKTESEKYVFTINGDKTEFPKTLLFLSPDQHGYSEYNITYVDEYGFSYSFKAYLVRQDIEIKPNLNTDEQFIDGVLTTTENFSISFSENAICTYTWNNSEEITYTLGENIYRDGVYRFTVTDHAGNVVALTIKKDTVVEFALVESNSSAVIQSGGVINSSKVSFEALNGDSAFIEKVFKNGVLQEGFDGSNFSEDGKWELIVSDKLGNKSYFCFYIVTKQKDKFAYTTPYEYHVTELWYDSGDGVKISYLKFVNHGEHSSSFEFSENGKYIVVMTSDVTGSVSQFEFTINTNAPAVSLVGCNVGETTINDVTLTGCAVGDRIKIYRATRTGEELVQEIEVTSLMTKMPTISDGGDYRIVVESEAGVQTELNFVRKHVMNTEGSIFIMVIIALAVIGLFVGLVYRNKSKTDK